MENNKQPKTQRHSVQDTLHSRAFKNGAYASVLCAVLLALAAVLNLFVGALPAKYLRYDMTENKLYSLSQETEDLCASLTQDVTFYYLGRTGQEDATVTELLDKYKDASSHIQLVQKDPVLYPTFGAAYDAADASVGSVILVCGERYRVVDANDLYTSTPNYETYTYDTEFDGEGALTSALSYVASEEAPVLYTLSGHGEESLSATLTDGAERQNMSFETLALLTADAVPENAATVVLNAPTKDLSAEEAERLSTYLASGGSLFLVTNYGDYSTADMPNLTALMAEYGMGAQDGIVIENDQSRYLSGYPYYLLPNVKSHDITQPLVDGGSYILAPMAHAITVSDTLPKNVSVDALLTTSANAYSKADAYNAQSIAQTAEDLTGAFNVAAAAQNSETGGKAVWISTSGLLNESIDKMVSGSNSDLVLNALSWLTGSETGITIHAKSLTTQTLTVPTGAASLWSGLLMFVIPGAMLLLGVVIWAMRRKR